MTCDRHRWVWHSRLDAGRMAVRFECERCGVRVTRLPTRDETPITQRAGWAGHRNRGESFLRPPTANDVALAVLGRAS